ncbi:hypothetical protein CAPTEDRAFT_185625 [Capitella teleta]|uniref:Serine/threonine-protein phosphatase 1 regulatory subunit 10 n=1 Tax=Capitella teleta TaxID=283909 RepID=R7UIF1_CAPTE|nr:hypothetical protein CAPTEDRAFT_185625 [Capitella teleta]|eukprot:ELU03563.1 hypothetical protein CAPTEDRAFT_185625 [Capitella teleta]
MPGNLPNLGSFALKRYGGSDAGGLMLLQEVDPMSPGSDIMEDVEEIIQIMHEELLSGKTVPNITFINILLCVSDPDILQRFVDIGGWGSLNDWLSRARDTQDDDLLMELLKIYAQMPVTVDLLKQNSCAKTIKHLSKSDRPVVKKEAGNIVDLWMQKVKGKPEDKSKKSKLKNGEKRRKKSSVDGSDNDSVSSFTDDLKRSKSVKSKSRSSDQATNPRDLREFRVHGRLTPSSLPTLKIRKRKISVEKPGCTTPPKQQRSDSDSMSPQEEKLVKLEDENEIENEEKKDEPVSPEEKKPLLPSFYKDTLDAPEEAEPTKEKEKIEESEEAVKVKKKKKRVTWVEEAKLKEFFYFPMDENERVNVNRIKDFDEGKRNEMMLEKKMNAQARSHDDPESSSSSAWRKPRLLTLPPDSLPPKGCNSTEREAQKKREEGVLFALYFTKNMIPDSGKEPEPESVSPCEPKVIPLEDETGTSGQVVYQEYPQPVREHKQQKQHPAPPHSSAGKFSLPPDVASLLANLAQQGMQGGQPAQPHMGSNNGIDMPQMQRPQFSGGGPPALDTSDPNNQHLIQAIMAGQPIEGVPEEFMSPLKQMLGLPPGGHGTAEFMTPSQQQQPPFNSMAPNDWQHRGMNGNGPPQNNGPPNMMGGGAPLLGQGPPGYGGPMGGGQGGPPYRGGPGRGPPNMMGVNQNTPVCRHFMNGQCRFGNSCRKLHPGYNCPPMPGMMGSPSHPGMSPPRSGSPS